METRAVADTLSTITTSMKTTFSSVGESVVTVISDAVPVALPILGAVLVVTVGFGVYKKITAKAG